MKSYLEKQTGKKLGVARMGFPKEVHFEAVLKEVGDDVAVFEDDEGREIALALDNIIYVGPVGTEDKNDRQKPGFK
jgi:hypothetical protein